MWWYKGQPFTQDSIQKEVGFVYRITNLTNNRIYIGKKLFSKAATKQVKGKRKRIRKPSDWEFYYGSNEELKNDVEKLGENNFRREILYLCHSRAECSYLELREQIDQRVLESNNYYNEWIMVKIRKSHLKSLYK